MVHLNNRQSQDKKAAIKSGVRDHKEEQERRRADAVRLAPLRPGMNCSHEERFKNFLAAHPSDEELETLRQEYFDDNDPVYLETLIGRLPA